MGKKMFRCHYKLISDKNLSRLAQLCRVSEKERKGLCTKKSGHERQMSKMLEKHCVVHLKVVHSCALCTSNVNVDFMDRPHLIRQHSKNNRTRDFNLMVKVKVIYRRFLIVAFVYLVPFSMPVVTNVPQTSG